MRIFLAGASGAIGQLIPGLVHAGHVVGGLTRSPSKTALLSHLGAEPILCDVFDRRALIQAVRDFKPDIVFTVCCEGPATCFVKTTCRKGRIAASSSINAVSFSSARTTKRSPSPRWASAIQIVRPLESIAET
jgi:hypothetical protein